MRPTREFEIRTRRVSSPVSTSKHNVPVPPLAVFPWTTFTSRSLMSVGNPTRQLVSDCLILAGKNTSDSSFAPSSSWPVIAIRGIGLSVAGAATQAEFPVSVHVGAPGGGCARIVRWAGPLAYISKGLFLGLAKGVEF